LVNQTLQSMKTRFLFPHKFRLAGILLLAIAIILCMVNYFKTGGIFTSTYLGNLNPIPPDVWVSMIYNDFLQISIVLGLLFIAFSKEKIEDEQLAQLRLDSLQWAVYVNYALFILCIIILYDWNFLRVIMFNIITPLIFFIVRFRWKIYSLSRSLKADII